MATVTYLEMAEKAAERIYLACQRTEEGQKRIKAILDAYNPKGSTRQVSFSTSKNTWKTAPNKSHVNYVVLDSDWEAELARVLESHPKVRAYVKNQGMQFEVPYRDGAVPRKYIPDFVVEVDDGRDDPLNLVLETKGYRGGDAQLKAETMRNLWVRGVNNLGTFGRWQFEEFTDVFEIEAAFGRLMQKLTAAQEKVDA
jgi:type III restriction enzyme